MTKNFPPLTGAGSRIRKLALAAGLGLLVCADAYPFGMDVLSSNPRRISKGQQAVSHSTGTPGSASGSSLAQDKERFAMFASTWSLLYASVKSGSVESLRKVVKNADTCKGSVLAVKAERLMVSRATLPTPDGRREKELGDWIIEIGPTLKVEQFGRADGLFVQAGNDPRKLRLGDAVFEESTDKSWTVDLGCGRGVAAVS